MELQTKQLKFMLLLERVGESLSFGVRGSSKNPVLYVCPRDVLDGYEADALENLQTKIPDSINVTLINVTKPSVSYDLAEVKIVGRHTTFSYLSPVHRRAADALTKILLSSQGQPNVDDFFNACALCRDVVNPHLWLHSFLCSALHRSDMRDFRIPNLCEIAPELFFEAKFLKEAHRQTALSTQHRAIVEVPVTFTGFDMDAEHKVAYWREDAGFNSFHWIYHIMNRFSAPPGSIDRQGELFYFVHHEMLARYNTERISNGLNRVVPIDLREGSVIEEAYFSKLNSSQLGGESWGVRQESSLVQDLNRLKDPSFDNDVMRLSELRISGDRIKEAVDAGFALSSDGKKVGMREENGLDILGGMLEASNNSVNSTYYGSLHNDGHIFIAYAHDPDFKHKEEPGVMASTAVSARDPSFWRWHYYIELIFRRQKDFMKKYTATDLGFPGISILQLEVDTPSLDANTLVTFWMQSDVDLSRGLDFSRNDVNNLGPVWARITHLQHREFTYILNVKSLESDTVRGNVRIFMAPQLDEQKEALSFNEQRNLFFQLDKFTITLRPGDNLIRRKSTDSTWTIPWDQTFRKLERKADTLTDKAEAQCGLGWPQHLLLPKGRHEGLPMDLFVMITDWEKDHVEDPGLSTSTKCTKNTSFTLGEMGKKYPDAKAMGFPFDRPPAQDPSTQRQPNTLAEFTKPHANMMVQQVKVFHRDVTIVRENSGGEEGPPQGTRTVSL